MPSQQFLELLHTLRNAPDRSGMSIDDLRRMQREQALKRPLASDIQCEPCDLNGVAAEWISAPNASPDRVLLYFHGGGYYRGSIDTVREMASRMSRASLARVLPIDYRLAPEHPFPAAVEDAITAYHWLLDHGYASDDMAVGGDSAGGGLTMALLIHARDAGLALPAAGICLSPWVDLAQSGNSYAAKAEEDPSITKAYLDKYAALYLGGADPKTPLASPLYADLQGLPPLLIQVGTAEVLLSDAVELAARARAAGVKVELDEWDQMTHVWQNNGDQIPESQEAVERIGTFIQHVLA
jgi:acetyl esterase/lipase